MCMSRNSYLLDLLAVFRKFLGGSGVGRRRAFSTFLYISLGLLMISCSGVVTSTSEIDPSNNNTTQLQLSIGDNNINISDITILDVGRNRNSVIIRPCGELSIDHVTVMKENQAIDSEGFKLSFASQRGSPYGKRRHVYDSSETNDRNYYIDSAGGTDTLNFYYDDQYPANNTNAQRIVLTDTDGKNHIFQFDAVVQQCSADDLSGDGTPENPWLIEKDIHLHIVSTIMHASNEKYRDDHFRFVNDIDLGKTNAPWSEAANYQIASKGFTPIATTKDDFSTADLHTNVFKGVFDCNGRTISNLFISNTEGSGQLNNGSYLGLFAKVIDGTIQNCRITNAKVIGFSSVGGFAGSLEGNATIVNSSFSGSVSSLVGISGVILRESPGVNVGGIAGVMYHSSSISDSYFTGTVSGTYLVGGLVGYMHDGNVANSYANANVVATGNFRQIVGGLIGAVYGGTVKSSYAVGTVKADYGVGGLIGSVGIKRGYSDGAVIGSISTISNVYATGDVHANGLAASLIGVFHHTHSSVETAYATGLVHLVQPNTLQSEYAGVGLGGLNSATTSSSPNARIRHSYWDSERNHFNPIRYRGFTEGTEQTTSQLTSGVSYPNWHSSEWNFTAGKYPRLKNVVCANRQYADPIPEDCTDL
ncbi:hypothetical protein COTS27_00861 [Spirochaetota bacterium]|nr:hypothetical protein COTS27_00861 [Spirochaetota bacterium]